MASEAPGQQDPVGKTTLDDRKARKRAADRLAQREHRRRQREHINELEARLRLIQEGAHPDAVTTLVAENARLKAELEKLQHFASSVSSAISQLQLTPTEGRGATTALENSNPREGKTALDSQSARTPPDDTNLARRPATNAETDGPHPGTTLPAPLLQSPQSGEPYSSEDHTPGRGPTFTMTKDLLESDALIDPGDMPVIHGGINESPQIRGRRPVEDIPPADVSSPLLSRSVWERLGQLDYTILPDLGESRLGPQAEDCDSLLHPHGHLQSNGNTMVDLHPTPHEWDSPIAAHKSIPSILFPAVRDDELLYSMIDRGRWRAVINGTKISQPKLIDCVLDTTANQFTLELKQYLEPMRRLQRNDEYFASYWLISTLIRWYVHQDESFYSSVPVWLRPSPLELRIPHPLVISFMPWPLLRDQLILDFHIHRIPVHPIMADLGEFLETRLSSVTGGFSIGEDQLVQSLRDLRNWRLKPGFFERYPRYRDVYQQYML